MPAKTNPGPAAQKRERTPGEKFTIATLEAIAKLRGLPKDTWTKNDPVEPQRAG